MNKKIILNLIFFVLIIIITLNLKTTVMAEEKHVGRMCIDTPQANETVEGTQMIVSGWVMSTDSKASVKIYIDGKEIKSNVTREDREDVLNVINGCGGKEANPQPGYRAKVNLKEYKTGRHELKVDIVSRNGETIRTLIQYININSDIKGRMCIDTPQANETVEGTQITVSGWAMSTAPNATLKIYIDEKETRNRSEKNRKRRRNTNNKRVWRKR